MGVLVVGLESSAMVAVMDRPRCWVAQEGPRDGLLAPVEEVTLMLIGARMLVGVSPVLCPDSSKESKLRQVEGVSMLTPSILLRGRVLRERVAGRGF